MIMNAENFAEWTEFIPADKEEMIKSGEIISVEGRVYYEGGVVEDTLIGVSVMFESDIDNLKDIVYVKNGEPVIDFKDIHYSEIPTVKIGMTTLLSMESDTNVANAEIGDIVESEICYDFERGGIKCKSARLVKKREIDPHDYYFSSYGRSKIEEESYEIKKEDDIEGGKKYKNDKGKESESSKNNKVGSIGVEASSILYSILLILIFVFPFYALAVLKVFTLRNFGVVPGVIFFIGYFLYHLIKSKK